MFKRNTENKQEMFTNGTDIRFLINRQMYNLLRAKTTSKNLNWPEIVRLLLFLVFCVVLLRVFTFWVPCCDVCYDFRIKAMFDLSLSPVVCRSVHVLLRTVCLFVYVASFWLPFRYSLTLIISAYGISYH
jgi:hypothetical protein